MYTSSVGFNLLPLEGCNSFLQNEQTPTNTLQEGKSILNISLTQGIRKVMQKSLVTLKITWKILEINHMKISIWETDHILWNARPRAVSLTTRLQLHGIASAYTASLPAQATESNPQFYTWGVNANKTSATYCTELLWWVTFKAHWNTKYMACFGFETSPVKADASHFYLAIKSESIVIQQTKL